MIYLKECTCVHNGPFSILIAEKHLKKRFQIAVVQRKIPNKSQQNESWKKKEYQTP